VGASAQAIGVDMPRRSRWIRFTSLGWLRFLGFVAGLLFVSAVLVCWVSPGSSLAEVFMGPGFGSSVCSISFLARLLWQRALSSELFRLLWDDCVRHPFFTIVCLVIVF